MGERKAAVGRILGIGVSWAVLWVLAGLLILSIIGVVDPDSIDPGEIQAAFWIFGAMGLFSGLAFGGLVALVERNRSASDLPMPRAVLWGIAGTAIVQAALLGHGDAGLAANVGMGLVFAALGGLIALAWLLITRHWFRRAAP